jgi:hypothetical protein
MWISYFLINWISIKLVVSNFTEKFRWCRSATTSLASATLLSSCATLIKCSVIPQILLSVYSLFCDLLHIKNSILCMLELNVKYLVLTLKKYTFFSNLKVWIYFNVYYCNTQAYWSWLYICVNVCCAVCISIEYSSNAFWVCLLSPHLPPWRVVGHLYFVLT